MCAECELDASQDCSLWAARVLWPHERGTQGQATPRKISFDQVDRHVHVLSIVCGACDVVRFRDPCCTDSRSQFTALEGRVIKATQYWTEANVADGLNALAICIEVRPGMAQVMLLLISRRWCSLPLL